MLVWGLVMFGNEAGRAIVITASLALPLLGIAGVVAGLRATYPRWSSWFVGANAITVLILYLPMVAPTTRQLLFRVRRAARRDRQPGRFVKLAFSSAPPL